MFYTSVKMNNLKENQILEVACQELSYEGLGVSRINNFPIVVKDFFPGELAKVKIEKIFSKYAKATVLEYVKKADYRNNLDIKNIDAMPLINMDYSWQIKFKQKYLEQQFKRNFNDLNINIKDYQRSDKIYNYRNKSRYPLSVIDNVLTLSTFIRDSDEITDEVSNELLNNESINIFINEILEIINEYYKNSKKQSNLKLFKSIVARVNEINEIQFALEIHSDFDIPKELEKCFYLITNLVEFYIIKKHRISLVFSKKPFYIKLLDKSFKISLNSFFQINRDVAKEIFNSIKDYAYDSQKHKILDLFCGVGVISNLIYLKGQKVLGIDIVKDAIDDAENNSATNMIDNFEFHAIDVFKSSSILKKFIDKDTLTIIDPPRSGLNNQIIKFISDNNIDNLIYLSCNPRTLIRDLKEFVQQDYKINYVKGYDMFPNTNHIEALVILHKNKFDK
ncbi:RNA methyltransferase [Mycoplasmopsis canis]|uniref:23S rRNA (uracil(1939)-C(5))-methyltransferase RlmD n=1 Tax=Mycoplasmopsis canis TaxID=29555 RepID=UPI000624CA69|nr:23S rRNA (uracil(1939)-C(5))-methyltransferase RlmD [Mycoplasmopsis canis]AKF40945.1 RNA methyltransferase [Mycoplasmopsis canis]